MNQQTFQAFRDELTKIAAQKGLGGKLKDLVSEGWHGPAEAASNPDHPLHMSWFGRGLPAKDKLKSMSRAGKAWEYATSLGGATKYLPVGAKSMMALGTGLMARDALREEDPTGEGRSRAERVVGLAGNTVGGLAATGALTRTGIGRSVMRRFPILGPMAAMGIGGGLAEKVVTAPFKPFRRPPPPPQPYQPDMYQPAEPVAGVPA